MKIFSIIGPTGVGKTDFTLELAQEILHSKKYVEIDLISVDSRQIYQGLEIISGADIPQNFKLKSHPDLSYGFYSQNKINLHGVSIIPPDQEWSVAHFQDLAWEIITWAEKENHLAILIGGTGLYHHQLANFDPALRVKPNTRVRDKAEKLSLSALQSWAQEVNPQKFGQMNRSDINNPRRLIRVIEVGLAKNKSKLTSNVSNLNQTYIGLIQDLNEIEDEIRKRVKKRWAKDAMIEVKALKDQYQDWSLPAFSSLGVKEISRYLNGFFSKEECLQQWTLHELQYARRQLTWWKNKAVEWFDKDDPEWKEVAFAYILNLC